MVEHDVAKPAPGRREDERSPQRTGARQAAGRQAATSGVGHTALGGFAGEPVRNDVLAAQLARAVAQRDGACAEPAMAGALGRARGPIIQRAWWEFWNWFSPTPTPAATPAPAPAPAATPAPPPAPTRPTLRPVTITQTLAPTERTTTGSAQYGVRWSVANPSANGWVIQHVTFAGSKTNCAGDAVATNHPNGLEYWEGWQVRNGQVFIGSGTDAHRADTFGTPDEGAGTRGRKTITGRVAYIEGFDLREPPWGHSVPEARALPTMRTAPAGWDDRAAQLHQLTVAWDDCATPKTHTIEGIGP
jgi:hypothetical protein